MAKMNDADLLRFLEEEAQQAYHYLEGDIASDRIRSMKEYLREPYGNEEEGRSAVVSSDVFDAVEGMLPDLVEVFVASDKAVVFDPQNAEDVDGAEQATNACNYVFYKQNNGFMTLYTAAKDGLLLKTGGVKWYWETKRTPTFTTYKAVDEMQLAVFLSTNPNAEVVEKDEVEPSPDELAQYQMANAEAISMGALPPVPPTRYTVKIKTVEEKGKVRVVNIPPDELHISRRHNSVLLDECPYVAHVTEKTLSDVREMGYSVTLDEIKAAQNDVTTGDHDYRESRMGGRWGWWKDDNELDESMVRGWLREEYVLVDYDGDGIAERRKIIRLGNLVLENCECSHVPIAAWTPYILTHRFDGLSVADLVSDFQRIGTEIMRQSLDNLYLANNQETIVATDNQGNPLANIDDLLNRRPGGIIRERVQGAVRPFQESWTGIQAQPMVEMLQVAKENRTGYTRYSQGLDSNSLNKTATGIQTIMNASQKRMKLMARIMAEALVAPMFRGIFKTLTDYSMEEISFRLNNKFVKYDPQEWRDQYDMTINVGIGTGDTIQQSQFLTQMAQAQAMVAGSPLMGKLLTPKNIYNLQARLAENAGFKNPGEFWTDPDTVPPPPPQALPPDPRVMVEQAKLQNDVHKTQAQMQMDAQKTQAELQAEQERFAAELAFKAQEAEKDRQFQLEMKQLDMQLAERARLMDMQYQQEQALGKDQEQNETNDAFAKALQMLTQAMMAPKRVIRDENGQAVGVAPMVGNQGGEQ